MKCPTKVPYKYCVMDHFHVTRIWCEKVGKKNCYMFRFEKVSPQTVSWWSPPSVSSSFSASSDPTGLTKATCIFCYTEEEQIYTAGWMCLNEKCAAFWTIELTPPPSQLQHTDHFLKPRMEFDPRRRPPCALRPRLFTPVPRPTYGSSRVGWKGIVCPSCGTCVSRVEWPQWSCLTPGCGYVYTLPLAPTTAREVADPHGIIVEGHAAPTSKCAEHIGCTHRITAHYRISTYIIPECGTVTHFQPNVTVNERLNGPDDMFVQLQETDLGLKRFPLSNSICELASETQCLLDLVLT